MSQTDDFVMLHFYRQTDTMPYKAKGTRAQWNELMMKKAVGAVICSKKSVKSISKEYCLPLETLGVTDLIFVDPGAWGTQQEIAATAHL